MGIFLEEEFLFGMLVGENVNEFGVVLGDVLECFLDFFDFAGEYSFDFTVGATILQDDDVCW